jgi:type VI secretion system secreted protein VgrG
VDKKEQITIGEDRSLSVGKNEDITIGANRSLSVGKNESINIAKTLAINVGDEISIVCGQASISMRKDGSIAISGKDISISGAGGVDVKATKDVVVKGMKVAIN